MKFARVVAVMLAMVLNVGAVGIRVVIGFGEDVISIDVVVGFLLIFPFHATILSDC